MNYQQYKPSEGESIYSSKLQSKDLIAFAAYLNVQNTFKKVPLRTYDYDLNFRQARPFYVNGKSQKAQSVLSEKPKKQPEKPQVAKSQLAKSVKPKIEKIKKEDMPLYYEPAIELKSKIQHDKHSKLQVKQEQTLPIYISEHSNIPNSKSSNSLKVVEPNTEKLQNILNDTFNHELQNEQQQKQVSLPMLQRIDHNQMYVGEKAKNIDALNQFLVEPSYKDTSKYISSKIDKNLVQKSGKKEKIEGFRIALPQSHKKQNKQQLRQQPHHHKLVESQLIQEQVKHLNEQVDKSKSKSKSKSNLKQVKDTYIHTRKPKLKHPVAEYTVHKESGLTPRKYKDSPKNNNSGHKTPTKKELQKKQKQIKGYQKEVFPVEDYDEIFDKQSDIKPYHNEEQSMSQCQEDIKINVLPQSGKHNVSAHGRSNGSEFNQSQQFSKDEKRDNFLQFYAISMDKLKHESYKKQKNEVSDHQRQLQTQKKSENHDKSSQHPQAKKQPSQKSSRKKIFSQTDKETKQKNSSSTDVGEFTEQQMRMILGAKGNKYKQAIIKQYIRINRATQKAN